MHTEKTEEELSVLTIIQLLVFQVELGTFARSV